MTQANESATESREALPVDSTIVVAVVTLWLYMVAVAYVRGLVGWYHADASWFDPSVFQLLAITLVPVACAVALCFCFVAIVLNDRESRVFTAGCIVVWVLTNLLMGVVAFLDVRSNSQCVATVLGASTFLVMPWIIRIALRRTKLTQDDLRHPAIKAVVAFGAMGLIVVVANLFGYFAGGMQARAAIADESRLDMKVIIDDGSRSIVYWSNGPAGRGFYLGGGEGGKLALLRKAP